MKLAVEKGCFAYKNGPEILSNICFEVSGGELLAILGPNGCGKSTLLRCMLGFLKWNSGRTLLDGQDIRGIPRRSLWQRLGYVPQARGAASACSVEEMLLLGRSSHISPLSRPGEEDFAVAWQTAEKLGLTGIMKKSCRELSGGQLQLVLIARALAGQPEVLVLDEPESNLDMKNQLLIMDTMTALAAEGMACVFNTHYPAHALRGAGKALMLLPGGEMRFGNSENVVTEENLRRAFGVDVAIGRVDTPSGPVTDVVPYLAGK